MNKWILVIDDERHVRTLLEHTLIPFEEAGVYTTTASSAEQALEFCRQGPPDLVFVDVGMPGIGGYAFCEALQAEPAALHTQIVLLIDMGREPNPDRCHGPQIVQIITKPFDPDHIRLLTGKLLNIDVEL